MLYFILLVFAFVFALIAAYRPLVVPVVHFGWLALALFFIANLFGAAMR